MKKSVVQRQRRQNMEENSTEKKLKRERSESEKSEDDARLLHELKKRRADVEEKLNFHQKLVEKACKGIKEIGKELAEGTIRAERLQFRKRVHDEYIRCLPTVRKVLEETKLEFENCCSLINDMESCVAASTSTPSNADDAAPPVAVPVPV